LGFELILNPQNQTFSPIIPLSPTSSLYKKYTQKRKEKTHTRKFKAILLLEKDAGREVKGE